MKIVNPQLAESIREQGMLKEPNSFGYIQLAAEVEKPRLLSSGSGAKKKLLADLKVLCATLKASSNVVQRADVFRAFIIPPGTKEGRELIARKHYSVHIATFDVVVLIECASVDDALAVHETPAFKAIQQRLKEDAKYLYETVAKNPKRIDEVSKETNGVFLFNFFYSEDTQTLLDVWEYTAGWWTAEANLTNSTPLEPVQAGSQYNLINHCRWDRLIDVLPALLFKPSMKKFVLANFTANNIVAMPILYRLA